MDRRTRKAAAEAFKDRKVSGGVYAVRCSPTGETWVGHWPDIATIKTRIWFSLRLGGHPRPNLTTAWRTHGEAAFTFQVLETLDDEKSPYVRDARLKEKAEEWRARLGASVI